MAEDADTKIAGAGKKTGKIVLIGVIMVSILAGGGGFVYLHARSVGDKAPKAGGAEARHENIMFPLDPFIVNLSDQNTNKFLRVAMQLELSNQAVINDARSKTPQIRDALIVILTSHTYDSLMQPEGKLEIKDEIIMSINQILGGSVVKNVYFTDFVMQ